MTTMIQYVLTLVIAGVLGLNAQAEGKSHKEKSHKERSHKEKKEHRKERKKEKKHRKDRDAQPVPVIIPDPVDIPEGEVIPLVDDQAIVNVKVGSGIPQ